MQHNPRFLALVEAIRPRVKETDVHQIKRWQDEGRAFHLVDVREAHEWADGHIPGAIHLPLSELSTRAGDLPEGKPVVLYCLSGGRSALAADSLGLLGFGKVYSLAGGLAAWRNAGLDVTME